MMCQLQSSLDIQYDYTQLNMNLAFAYKLYCQKMHTLHTVVTTIDQEIFTQLIRIKTFVLLNFHGSFNLQIFYTLWLHMDKHLEHSQCLVYYQVLGEPGITGCNAAGVRSSRQSDIHLGRCGSACTLNNKYHCFLGNPTCQINYTHTTAL